MAVRYAVEAAASWTTLATRPDRAFRPRRRVRTRRATGTSRRWWRPGCRGAACSAAASRRPRSVGSGGISALLSSVPAAAAETGRGRDRDCGPLLGFTGIAVSSADTVVVPEGYTAKVLIAWGDPVSDGPAFKPDASNTAADQAQQWGMHNDGVVYFPIDGSRARPARAEQRVHRRRAAVPRRHRQLDAGEDRTSRSTPTACRSSRSRRRRAATARRRVAGRAPVAVRPPHHRHDADRASAGPRRRRPTPIRLVTSADPTGRSVLGTLNNCAMGFTPWGTYLACEENFNGYFRKTGAADRRSRRRYGITPPAPATSGTPPTRASAPTTSRTSRTASAGWSRSIRSTRRRRRSSAPRSAASSTRAPGCRRRKDGRVVVYMGDDEQFEYIYRYVSNLPWRKARSRASTRSTTACSTSPSSTPTAPASGCRSRRTTRRWPAGR